MRDAAAAIAVDGMPAAHAAHAALGATLRAYRFDRYRTKEGADDKPKLRTLTLLSGDHGRRRGRLGAVAGGRRTASPCPATSPASRPTS